MFSEANTELLTRVGPGTSMGALVRRYWIPALLLRDVAEPNGDPVRVRLVGENFIAWRDAKGKLGFFDEYCPHRGASLALGHAEGDGLRCLYHGWKFATDGTILETPNCKAANFRERVKAKVYPLREAGGLLWVYLGPKDKEPPFPHYRFFDIPVDELAVYHATIDCNFVQMMEGTIDPAHANMLHQDGNKLGKRYTNKAKLDAGDRDVKNRGINSTTEFVVEDDAPECEAEDLTFGVHGVARLAGLSTDGKPITFARVHTWVMPFMALPGIHAFVISVPIDDEHTTFFYVDTSMTGPANAEARALHVANMSGPASSYTGHHFRFGAAERWGQDRARMKHSFTGIEGVVPEDYACAISMGPIYDRSREHLAPADQLIVRMRRRMLQAARELESGIEPYMLKPEESLILSGKMNVLPENVQWQEFLVPNNMPFRVAG
jgi:nitrite reductase/ring-hydroxylating ferredoxin subunit